MIDASEIVRINLQCQLADTSDGIGLEIIISGFATEAAARAVAEKIRHLLKENTQQIFGEKSLLQ